MDDMQHFKLLEETAFPLRLGFLTSDELECDVNLTKAENSTQRNLLQPGSFLAFGSTKVRSQQQPPGLMHAATHHGLWDRDNLKTAVVAISWPCSDALSPGSRGKH